MDAIDKDGIVFSATPSGAWLPSVIAGDTGIPLTQRAQSFLLVPGHPNELAGGKRPRVTLSPTLVTQGRQDCSSRSRRPAATIRISRCCRCCSTSIEFGMNAEKAVEAPRFQTRHLVSSFDNHAMNPGDLLLDERISTSVVAELAERRHRVSIRSRWSSGAAPVMIRITPEGVIEAGADPFYYPRRAGVVRFYASSFDEPSILRPRRAGRAAARPGRAQHLHRRQFLEVRRLAGPDLHRARATSYARPVLEEAVRSRVPARVCRDLPHRLRRFRLLPVPDRRSSGSKLFAQTPEGFRFAFKVPEQITCKVFPTHARYGPQAGTANRVPGRGHVQEMFLRPLLPHRAKTALLIFEFGAFSRRSFDDVGEFLDRLDPFLAALPPEFRYAVEIRNPEFLEPDYFACLRSHRVAHVYNAWSKMPELRRQIAIPDSVTADFRCAARCCAPGGRTRKRWRCSRPTRRCRIRIPRRATRCAC